MSWLPILIMVTIVDRNPVAPEDIRGRLNELVDDVRVALLDEELRDSYVRETHKRPRDFAWTQILGNDDYFQGAFFSRFAGQGRLRWHYGVAHPILAGTEKAFREIGRRDWLSDEDRALTHMVDGPRDGQFNGLRSFDYRMLWQISGAITIVIGTATGAFLLSCACTILLGQVIAAYFTARFHTNHRSWLSKWRIYDLRHPDVHQLCDRAFHLGVDLPLPGPHMDQTKIDWSPYSPGYHKTC